MLKLDWFLKFRYWDSFSANYIWAGSVPLRSVFALTPALNVHTSYQICGIWQEKNQFIFNFISKFFDLVLDKFGVFMLKWSKGSLHQIESEQAPPPCPLGFREDLALISLHGSRSMDDGKKKINLFLILFSRFFDLVLDKFGVFMVKWSKGSLHQIESEQAPPPFARYSRWPPALIFLHGSRSMDNVEKKINLF